MTTLYRACDGYTGQWSCWTPDAETAEEYRNNPGFGGQQIVECVAEGRILDIRGDDAMYELAVAIDSEDPDEQVREWRGDVSHLYEIWENSKRVREALIERFDWIVHNAETFPERATTYVRIN